MASRAQSDVLPHSRGFDGYVPSLMKIAHHLIREYIRDYQNSSNVNQVDTSVRTTNESNPHLETETNLFTIRPVSATTSMSMTNPATEKSIETTAESLLLVTVGDERTFAATKDPNQSTAVGNKEEWPSTMGIPSEMLAQVSDVTELGGVSEISDVVEVKVVAEAGERQSGMQMVASEMEEVQEEDRGRLSGIWERLKKFVYRFL